MLTGIEYLPEKKAYTYSIFVIALVIGCEKGGVEASKG
jgi:hypothetical protein